jgi:hypothetical protein
MREDSTKCDVAIAHETCDVDRLICSKTGNFAACQEVPSYASVSCIIADGEPACTTVTRIVDRYPSHVFMMSLKPSLNCQSIMMEDKDRIPLRIQQV